MRNEFEETAQSSPFGGQPFKITVHSIAGRNLAAKDSNGKSDPFVEVGYLENFTKWKVLMKTKVIPKDLNPDWDLKGKDKAKFKFSDRSLMIQVFDKDMVGYDFLGVMEVSPTLVWFLQKVTDKDRITICGTLGSVERKNKIFGGTKYDYEP